MRSLFTISALSALLCGASGELQARNVVLETFDSQPPGSFGSAYSYADTAANPASAIVSPGVGGAGQALQFTANLHSGTNANAGVNLPAYMPAGNSSPNLADYTLSFDLAIAGGDPGAFYVALNVFGAGFADGLEYDIMSGSLPVAGSGFRHFSVNLGTLPHAYNVPLLNPTDSQYNFQLVLLGFPPSVTATPEAVLLDNLQVTTTATNSPVAPSYINPPIYADFPDPDIIRVGSDFYFSTTTFVDAPGLTILHSKDLLHWEIVSHVIPQLDFVPNISNGVTDYRNGVFASSLRYYKGTFYVVDTPNGSSTRVYYSTNAAGPWQYHKLNVGAFDPGFYIETNGVGYIATAGGWQNLTTFLTLNSTYSQVVASTAITNNLGLEGSKVVKRGGYYYIFNAQPSTASLYVSRSTNLFGPYTFMKILDDGHGGHQGAIVDMPDGTDYGFVMRDSGPIGRMTFISPIYWTNGWPVWGVTNAPGRVPASAPMPIVGAPDYSIPASDDFSSAALNLQWQWNHNPDNTRWSLTERPGFLRLHPSGATNFWYARNTLIQKGLGPFSAATIKCDLSGLQTGDICGFGTLGKTNGNISITPSGGGEFNLSMNVMTPTDGSNTNFWQRTVATAPFSGTTIYLRTAMDFAQNKGLCSYSPDGVNWTPLGGAFNLAYDWQTGTFQGEKYAIFCYNAQPGAGFFDIDWFRLEPPAVITRIVPNPDSTATLSFESSPNSTNVISASSNLGPAAMWQNIATNKADSNGIWQFTDFGAVQQSARFYRARSRQP